MQKIIITLAVIFLVVIAIYLFSKQRHSETPIKATPSATKQEKAAEPVATSNNAMKINVEKSTIQWSAKKIIGEANHRGTIEIKNGSLLSDSDSIIEGIFVIDMDTIENTDIQNQSMREKFVSHLKSADFFDVEKFPETTLFITDIAEKADSTGVQKITGDLTIKNITNQITFPAKISPTNSTTIIDATFSINRTDWDIKFGSSSFFDNLGDQAIDDMMNFEIHIET